MCFGGQLLNLIWCAVVKLNWLADRRKENRGPWLSCFPRATHRGFPVLPEPHTLVVLFSQSHTPWLSCSPRALHLGCPVLPEPYTLAVLFSQSHTPWLSCSPRALHLGCPVLPEPDVQTTSLVCLDSCHCHVACIVTWQVGKRRLERVCGEESIASGAFLAQFVDCDSGTNCLFLS